MKNKRRHHTVYFAGEYFTQKHLIGNAYLAEAIYEKSHGRFLCVLPQNIEHRAKSRRAARDRDIKELLECDLALFNFEGAEIGAGTLAAFMIAKFADIPSVILRSDSRGGEWSAMADFFPRTVKVVVDGPGLYKTSMKRRRIAAIDEIVRLAGQHSSVDAQLMCEQIAQACARALDRALKMKPRMPKHVCGEVYNWLALMPGFQGKEKAARKLLNRLLEDKIERDLL